MRIGLSSGREFVSKFIKWITRSEASHTFICFDVAGEEVVLHANQHGVNCTSHKKFTSNNDIVCEYDIKLTKANTDKALGHALRKLHSRYDYFAAFGFLWVLINKSFGRKVKNPMPNRSAYMCTELVVMALRKGNFPGSEDPAHSSQSRDASPRRNPQH